ncbi:sulfotransferase ssu-1-like [Oppia nitens]|uniref:sulfotransferase ssu-1-like n=1 Tax=Oppia nitens TaxID=1686743 RepID=UPI0023D9CA5B|nr:sulfotransferase ssu-1-like [Oppia nitens]
MDFNELIDKYEKDNNIEDFLLSVEKSKSLKLDNRYRLLVSGYRSGSNWFIYIIQLILSEAMNTSPVDDEDFLINNFEIGSLDRTRKMFFKNNLTTDEINEKTNNNNKDNGIILLKQNMIDFQIQSKANYMLLLRNPKDVFNSTFKAIIKRLQTKHPEVNIGSPQHYQEFLDYWLSDRLHKRHDYFSFVNYYWKYRSESNFQIILYEDMIREPRKAIETIAQFLGDEYRKRLSDVMNDNIESTGSSETLLDRIERLASIDAMKPIFDRQDNWRIRKGINEDWRSHMTKEQSDAIDRKIATEWKGTGIELLWEREMKW